MRIEKKLMLSNMLMAIIPVVVVGIVIAIVVASKFSELDKAANENGVKVITKKADNEIEKAEFAKLNAVQKIKKKQICVFFDSRKNDMEVLVDTVETLQMEALKKLTSAREVKKASILRYFQTITDGITTFSENTMIVDSMEIFNNEFPNKEEMGKYTAEQINEMKNSLSSYYQQEFSKEFVSQNKEVDSPANQWLNQISNEAILMQYHYIYKNPKPLGHKDLYDMASDGTQYSVHHAKVHPIIRNYLKKMGYYDIFLVNNSGVIVYSVFKELDYATSLTKGPHSNSGLAEVFKKASYLKANEYILVDYKQYGPSYNAPAGFIASPLYKDNKKIGTLIFQMPIDKVNEIMLEDSGLGETGETLLVGPDYLMRSDSALDKTRSVINSFRNQITGKFDTEATRSVFEKNIEGIVLSKDYRNQETLEMFGPLQVGNLTWCLIAKADIAEFFCPAEDRKKKESYFFHKFKEQYGYYDLFLINPDGYCFYTVEEESDYQTNLLTGKYKNSNLGKLINQVSKNKNFGFADFAPYAPSNDEPAAFIAQPVLDKNGNIQVIIALQLSLHAINSIMSERTGMGETGETYLVGMDLLMRSDSFLDPKNHSVKASFANPLLGKVDTEAAKEALAGKTDSKIITDYNGNLVLSSYSPVDIFGTQWAILAEIDKSEAYAVSNEMTTLSKKIEEQIKETESKSLSLIMWIIVALCIVAGILAYFIARMISKGITRPICRTVEVANAMAAGDMTQKIEYSAHDETGELATALNKTTENLSEMILSIKDNANMLNNSSKNLADVSETLVSGAENMTSQSNSVAGTAEQMSTNIDGVASAVEEMGTNINTMASAVEEMSANTGTVSSAAEQMSQNMNAVASAIEEMSTSINGIAKHSKEGKQVAQEAMEMAENATSTMNILGEAAKEIGQVTDTIKSIAQKTDLLALNATIEAASAGDAGKGFAVVANEIKGLANRSAQAAEDIAKRIDGVQKNSAEAVDVIQKVAEIIAKINNSMDVIAVAVDEQTKTSNEIASNVNQANTGVQNIADSIGEIALGANDISKNAGEAAKGLKDISQNAGEVSIGAKFVSENIQGVNQAASDSSQGAGQVNTSASELSNLAIDLNQLVSKFKINHSTEIHPETFVDTQVFEANETINKDEKISENALG